ncbi:unnamed protein product [Phytomonas sp. EM1]|nr:unnamed protein product [Phytomonas sp. EM1]|eukprot:CCW60317.1 unnamed protein product [Phytomonas sp. isolate EM1]
MPESMKTEALMNLRSDFANDKASPLLVGGKPRSESGMCSPITRNSDRDLKHNFIRDELTGSKMDGFVKMKAPPSRELDTSALATRKGKAKTTNNCEQLDRGEGGNNSDSANGTQDLVSLQVFLERYLNSSYLVEYTDAPLAKALLSRMDSYLCVPVLSLLQLSEFATFLEHVSPSNRLEKLLSAIRSSSLLTLRDDLVAPPATEVGAASFSMRVGPTTHASPTSLCTLLFQCDPNDTEAVAVLRGLSREQVKAALPGLSVLIVEPYKPCVQETHHRAGQPLVAYATLANCADALRALVVLQDTPLHAGLAVRLRFEKPSKQDKEMSTSAQSQIGVPKPPLPVAELEMPDLQYPPFVNRRVNLRLGIQGIDGSRQIDPKRPTAVNGRHLFPLTPPSSVDADLEDFIDPKCKQNLFQRCNQGHAGGFGANGNVARGGPLVTKDNSAGDGGDLSSSISHHTQNTTSLGTTEILASGELVDPSTEFGGPNVYPNKGGISESSHKCTNLNRCGSVGGLSNHRAHSGLDPLAAPWMGWTKTHPVHLTGAPVASNSTPPGAIKFCRCDPYTGNVIISTGYPRIREPRTPHGVVNCTRDMALPSLIRGGACKSHFKDPLKIVSLNRRMKNEVVSLNPFSGDTSSSSVFNSQYIVNTSTNNTDDNISNFNSRDGS